MLKNLPLITTTRCILRLPTIKEAMLMADFANQNKSHLSLWEALQNSSYYTENYWLNKILAINEDFLNDKSCSLNIYLKENSQLIGMVNFTNFIRGCFHSCFLGFKIASNLQNKGLMTESIKAAIIYVFEDLNLHRISANYMPHNIASARVLEKCGFIKEGIAKDYLYINNKWEEHILTSLLNERWVDRSV